MLYPSMAIFSHSCSPSTQALHRPDHGLTLTATRTIRAGEEITVTYTELWGGAVHRREDITNWFFHCSCQRCQDQEDLGSDLDTWRCWRAQCQGLLALRYVQLWPGQQFLENLIDLTLKILVISNKNKIKFSHPGHPILAVRQVSYTRHAG